MNHEDQFKFDWFSGTGKGGQHRNKHQNCCRCTHLDTGITGTGQSSRSRETNKEEAYRNCLSKVQAFYHRDKDRFLAGHERVRTYHEADNRVTDHASDFTLTYKEVMEKDGFDKMLEARAKAVRN
jgi:protein subunit release factor A